MTVQLVQLRFRAVCEVCGSKLPPRSEAWHDDETGATTCPTCQRVANRTETAASYAEPNLLVGQEPEPERLDRSAETEQPRTVGPLVMAEHGRDDTLSHNGPQSSRLPRVGPSLAAGLEVSREIAADKTANSIARALEIARPHGLEILRSRPWVGTRVDTEDVVVGPSGVWVVDGLGSPDEPVARGFLAGSAGAELLNVVGGRTSIISGLLFDSPHQWVPVRGALCFDGQVPVWFDDPFVLAGISITTPRALVDQLFTPLHLDAPTRSAVASHLSHRF